MPNDDENINKVREYTRNLREVIDENFFINKKEISELQDKYNLSESDIDSVNKFAENSFLEAESFYDDGNWDKALKSIEESFYKSPINSDILKLYYLILIECYTFSNNENKYLLDKENVLKKIKSVDKVIYFELKHKYEKSKLNKKTLFILLVPIIILIVFLFASFKLKKPSKNEISTQLPPIRNNLPKDQVYVEIDNSKINQNLKIETLKSKINISENSFVYNLQFNLYSETKNIKYIEGEIIWYDINNKKVLTESFSSNKNIEYYKNEKIPFNYIKSSLRSFPTLDRVIVQLNSVIAVEGLDRELPEKADVSLPYSLKDKLNFYITEYRETRGTVSNYLSLKIIIENKSIKKINKLSGYIEWLDIYNQRSSSNELDFIKTDNLPLEINEKRLINKTIELNGEITNSYRIVIDNVE